MDLKPVKPTAKAPRRRGKVIEHGYNWGRWEVLLAFLEKYGVTLESFDGLNDGKIIPAKKCIEVADAMDANINEVDEKCRKWMKKDSILWRTCGGYRQT